MLNKIIILAIIIAASSALYAWLKPVPENRPADFYYPVPVEKPVTKIKKIFVHTTSIRVYEKKEIVKVLNLPAWLKADENKQVIAAGEISPYKGKTSVVAIIDTQTGDGSLIQKQLPLPLFSFENQKEIGARYGMTSQMDIYGRWTFARLGLIYIAGYGEVNTAGNNNIMIEASYRW